MVSGFGQTKNVRFMSFCYFKIENHNDKLNRIPVLTIHLAFGFPSLLEIFLNKLEASVILFYVR